MPRPLKEVVRSVRLTKEEDERYSRMMGYRKLWTFSELVVAGLELLHAEEQEHIAAWRPLPEPPPPARPKRKGKS